MQHNFQTISPIDNSVYLERSIATNFEIEKTLTLSQRAQKTWRNTTFEERATICKKMVDYFLQNVEEISKELTWQMGRPIRYTPYELKGGLQERAHYMIDIAEQTLANIIAPKQKGFRRFVQRDPLGTVLVLAPWNYPYLTSVNAIIPALMPFLIDEIGAAVVFGIFCLFMVGQLAWVLFIMPIAGKRLHGK